MGGEVGVWGAAQSRLHSGSLTLTALVTTHRDVQPQHWPRQGDLWNWTSRLMRAPVSAGLAGDREAGRATVLSCVSVTREACGAGGAARV